MKYVERHLAKIVERVSKQFPVVLVTGPRQVGKTTMLKKLAEAEGINRGYVTLDSIEDRILAKQDPAMFLKLNPPPVLIDEVQYAPELFTYIKIHVDKTGNKGDFWLTGSQLFRLMRGVQESLAGRVALLTMTSLSQSEIMGHENRVFNLSIDELTLRQRTIGEVNNSVSEIFTRIWSGNMPAICSNAVEDKNIFYGAYITTYIERDVNFISPGIDALKFFRFIQATAALDSHEVNYKTIAYLADIDQVTVKNWLNILETLGIIFYLHPFSRNTLKRIIKKPKLYFFDTGLVCHLTKWSSPEVAMNGAMSGALMENYIVSEIIKSYNNDGQEPFVYYYRDKDGKEIDMLIETDGALYPIEIKKTMHPEKRMIDNFSVVDKMGLTRGTSAVVCLSDKLSAFDKDNLIVPVGLI